MKLQPDEDVESAWSSRETHEARMEFLQTLPDDALNCLVESNFWPYHVERVELMTAVYAHSGLTMLTAMSNYAGSPALYIGSCELNATAHHEAPEVVEFLLGVRDKLNDFAFVDVVAKYQSFSSPLKILLRDNSEEKYGRFALDPAVIQYGRDVMEKDKAASDKKRYSVGGEVLNNKELVQALVGAVEDPRPAEGETKLGRAALWLRGRVMGR